MQPIGRINWANPSNPAKTGFTSGRIDWGGMYKQDIAQQQQIQQAFQTERDHLQQIQKAKGINNPSSLLDMQARAGAGQISKDDFIKNFGQASQGAKGTPTPYNFKITPGTVASEFGNNAKNIGTGFVKGLTQSEQTVAKVGARVLPGGQNDLTAENASTDTSLKNLHFINTLKASGAIDGPTASKLIKNIQQGQTANAKDIKQTQKSIPTKGQAAAGVVGTAADILTAGALPEIKGASTVSKVGRAVQTPASFGVASGANAAAGGGTKKQIAENAVAGAAFPAILSAGAKVLPKAVNAVKDGMKPLGESGVRNTEAATVEGKAAPTPTVKTKSTTPLNESGGIPIGQAQDLIDKHQQSVKFSGDIQRFAASSEGAKGNLLNDSAKLIKNRTQLAPEEKTQLQALRDARATKQELPQVSDKVAQADKEATDFAKATIKNDVERAKLEGNLQKAKTLAERDPESYTHRVAQGKGSAFDYVLQNDRKNPLSVNLGKTTPADKTRVYHAITDEQGNRRVVAIKNNVLKNEAGQKIAQGKLVTALGEGGTEKTPLGKLSFKTNQDFLDKELRPYQTKINNLTKEGDALAKVKVKGGVSGARITALARKVSLLEDPGNMSTLTKAEAKSLRDAQLKLKELTNVKPGATNATKRLETINQKLIEHQNQVNKIESKYDPEQLNDKIFVGKDSKKYKIGQATADEITKASGQKYFTDPSLTNHAAYLDSRIALENARMFDAIKKAPESKTFMVEPGETAPKGWKSAPGVSQFQGYKFEPKVAEAITDMFSSREPAVMNKASQFLRQTIVYFPIKHDFNMAAAYAVDRGASSLVNPMAYGRMFKSWGQALNDLHTKGDFYQSVAKQGFGLTTNDKEQFEKVFKQELQKLSPSQIDKFAAVTKLSPTRLYKAIQRVSVWEVQDFLNLARIHERMSPTLMQRVSGHKMNLEDAVKQTEKYSFQYKTPSRVMGSRTASKSLRSPIVFFGAYKYDQYKIVLNAFKGALNITKPGEAVKNADKAAALIIGALVLWPEVNKGIQKLTGNPNAHSTAPGPLGVPEAINNVRTHKQTAGQAAGNQVSIGPIQPVLNIKSNTDSFTGKKIADPNVGEGEQMKQRGKYLFDQLAPVQKVQGTKNASPGKKAISVVLSLAGASLPKNSPQTTKLSSLKYDSLPNARSEFDQKVQAGDVNGAKQTANSFNKQVLNAAKAALKASNKPVPSDKQLYDDLRKGQYLLSTSNKTIKNAQKPKQNTLDKLLRTKR